MSKAASTHLQKDFFPLFNEILLITRNTDNIISELLRILKVSDPIILKKNIDSYRDKINSFLNINKNKKIIISDEWLFGSSWQNFYNSYSTAKFLNYLFPGSKIIYIIRRQDDWCESVYNQVIKNGFSISPNKFFSFYHSKFYLSDDNYLPFVNVSQLDYLKKINFYENEFGNKNILVLPFESIKDNSIKFYEKISNFIDVKINKETKIKKNNSNQSINIYTYYILRILNRFILNDYNSFGFIPNQPFLDYLKKINNKNFIIRVLYFILKRISLLYLLQISINKISKKKYVFFNEERKKIIFKIHRHSNRELSKKFNLDLDKYHYF